MLGPLFRRELVIAPRRSRLYTSRTVFTVMFLILTATAWLILSGSQHVRDLGDMARFGKTLFAILAPLQLVLAMFFSAIFSAGNVSQEKDRNTLVLLLMTRMNSAELMLGKLAASLVHLLSNFLAVFPVFFAILCFGGVDLKQLGQCFLITGCTILLCGTLGTFLAFWREQTFQALATAVLVLVVWLAVGEAVPANWSTTISPWRAMLAVTGAVGGQAGAALPFAAFALTTAFVLCAWGILRVRAWNIGDKNRTREDRAISKEKTAETTEAATLSVQPAEEGTAAQPVAKAGKSVHALKPARRMWNNPILWREVRTHAYGRRAFWVRVAFVLIFAAAAIVTHLTLNSFQLTFYQENQEAALWAMKMFLPLALLGLVLVNAQAVTAITGERSNRAIDLLLVTTLTPKEILFGKLGGVFWNTREMVVLPLAFLLYFGWRGLFSVEITAYLFLGLCVLYVFSAMLGIHAGMTYAANRSAIGVSLGTLFFLFVGVAVCLRMMLSLGGSFHAQLQPFLAFMVGGGVALYLALGVRNPSSAIGLASFLCPFATFYAMSALMMNYTLGVFLVVAVTYGFATAAMLIPALSEFDIAMDVEGRAD